MTLPIQVAPIDRANRAAMLVGASHHGLTLSQPKVCDLCDLLPPPASVICKFVCPKIPFPDILH